MLMARRGNQRGDETKAQEWRRHITVWRDSGLSVRAYCRRAKVREASFYWWRRRLGETPGRAMQPAARRPPLFVAVGELATDPPAALEVLPASPPVVRVRRGFCPETPRAVVAALGAPRC